MYYNLGIGALVRLGQRAGVYSDYPKYGTGNTTADSVNNLMNSSSRGVIPFISLGISADIRKHIKVQLSVEPTLLNCYEPGTLLHYRSSSATTDIQMDYQPVYFGVKVCYFVRSVSE